MSRSKAKSRLRKNVVETRAMNILRNIPKRILGIVKHQGDVQSEKMLTSATKCLEILSRSSGTTDDMMTEAWTLYTRVSHLCNVVPQKFLDNDHNKPLRVSTIHNFKINGISWGSFYYTELKEFNQYYRHGGNWRYGMRLWK